MLTQAQLEADGWAFDPATGEGMRNGNLVLRVACDAFPLFALIRAANHLEGDDELMDGAITPEIVLQVSGETWDNSADLALAQMAAAEAHGAALVQLRMIRDRVLAQTDYIEVWLANPSGFAPLPQPIQDAISANNTAWIDWRQAMRDLPANVTDPVAAVADFASVHVSTDTFPAPWPQPPAAPVIHLT